MISLITQLRHLLLTCLDGVTTFCTRVIVGRTYTFTPVTVRGVVYRDEADESCCGGGCGCSSQSEE